MQVRVQRQAGLGGKGRDDGKAAAEVSLRLAAGGPALELLALRATRRHGEVRQTTPGRSTGGHGRIWRAGGRPALSRRTLGAPYRQRLGPDAVEQAEEAALVGLSKHSSMLPLLATGAQTGILPAMCDRLSESGTLGLRIEWQCRPCWQESPLSTCTLAAARLHFQSDRANGSRYPDACSCAAVSSLQAAAAAAFTLLLSHSSTPCPPSPRSSPPPQCQLQVLWHGAALGPAAGVPTAHCCLLPPLYLSPATALQGAPLVIPQQQQQQQHGYTPDSCARPWHQHQQQQEQPSLAHKLPRPRQPPSWCWL